MGKKLPYNELIPTRYSKRT